jgi:hypothetical protein
MGWASGFLALKSPTRLAVVDVGVVAALNRRSTIDSAMTLSLGPRRVEKSTLVGQQSPAAMSFDLLDSRVFRSLSADPAS